MRIRPIEPQDNEQIAAVIRTVFMLEKYPTTGTAFADKQLDFMFQTYAIPKAIYYVAEENRKIIGGAGVKQLDHSEDFICELQKMYFLNHARGKGFGYEIIKKCLSKAKEMEYKKCYLETLPQMVAAQGLYKKVGFEYLSAPLGGTGHTNCPIWMLKSLE